MDLTLRLQLSTMMFLQYFVWGAWGVVIFKYLASLPSQGGLNFPGNLQGWIGATLPIGAMISPMIVGLFADRFFDTEKVLAVLHLAGAVLLLMAAQVSQRSVPKIRNAETDRQANRAEEGNPALKQAFRWLFWIMLGYALCYMPTISLTNSLSLRSLANPDQDFSSIRVLGTIGWIVAGLIVGLLLNEVSAKPLYLAAGASAVLGVFCLFLPHTPPVGEAKTLKDALGLPALEMLKDSSFLIFFICSFLIMIVLAFYYQQGNVFVTDIGAPYPAALQTLGQFSEIFFMLLIPVGLEWFGTKGMLAVGMAAWCVRYAVFATRYVPAVIAIGLPIHGICYDFFFVVSYLYVDRQAPPDLRASAQGMITFITLGVGLFFGNLLAGQVVKKWKHGPVTDWKKIWLVPLAGSVVATLLFGFLFSEPPKEKKPDTATSEAVKKRTVSVTEAASR